MNTLDSNQYRIRKVLPKVEKKSLIIRFWECIYEWYYCTYQKHLKKYYILRVSHRWIGEKFKAIYFLIKFDITSKNIKSYPIVKLSSLRSKRLTITESACVKIGVSRVFPSKHHFHLDATPLEFIFPEIFVRVLNNASLSLGSNFVFMDNKVICHDLYDFSKDYTSEELHQRVRIDINQQTMQLVKRDREKIHLTKAATFIDACSLNYAHWLTEVLPRICIFCSDERFQDIPIIINEGLHPNLWESLFMVIDSKREIIVLSDDCVVRASILYIISPSGYIPFGKRYIDVKDSSHGVFSPDAFHLLRKTLLPNLSADTDVLYPKKIYVRRGSKVRKLINEKQIEALLGERGFVIIDIDKLNFVEQCLLFQNVEVVVAPTGAACANILFSKLSVRLVVLMGIHENMPYAYWRNICNTVGITDVSYVLGDIMNSKDLDFHANYEIQPNDLIDCLDTLGITL